MTLFLLIVIALLIYYFFINKDSAFMKLNLGNSKKCPNCHNSVEQSFNVCPFCKETLKKKCMNCGEKIDVSWKFCPYCEKPNDGSGRK